MSMPSSSDDVATTHGSRPDFRSSSTPLRCSRDIEPWCALASTGGAPYPTPDRPAGDPLRVRLGLGAKLVQPCGQPFGQPPRVAEHDRGPMFPDQPQDA